jgi:PEP-CTERM motif
MKKLNFRVVLSVICLASFLPGLTRINAAPVQFNEVVQFVSAKPGKASTGSFSQLGLAANYTGDETTGDDDDDKKKQQTTQDGRVITSTTTEVVLDEDCNCVQDDVIKKKGFPYWALLGLAAIPIAIILIKRKKDTPTPTPSIPITQTPTVTPSVTVTPTVTPTPPMTPTPPPEPVPEPMTILLFGTGLAGIGMAARKRFGKKDKKEENEG